jgi:signal transduction histidine kinase
MAVEEATLVRLDGREVAVEFHTASVDFPGTPAVRVDAGGGTTLESESLAIFLFRATRELLSNVVRHAGVHEATVRLRRMGRSVGLRVSDQGRGFDPQGLKDTAGFGLLGIRERVELLGGRVKVVSVKGRGTRVRIVVPDTRPD